MSVKWTENQQKAIEASGKTLIVSAGAGSGKTSVLTERIMQKLISGKDINDFLIVTFTRAAAADMREKLYEKISAETARRGGADVHLRNQLNSLPSAQIGTIHSFCLNAVKQNFHLLSLSPGVRTLDETDCAAMLLETVSRLAEKELEKETPNEDFMALYDNFSSRKDQKAFTETVAGIYTSLRAYPFYFDMLENKREELKKELKNIKEGSVSDCVWFVVLKDAAAEEIKAVCERYEKLVSLAESSVNSEKYAGAIRLAAECANKAKDLTRLKYEEAAAASSDLSFPSLPPVRDESSAKARELIRDENAALKAKLKKALETLYSESREQIISDLEKTGTILRGLAAFLKEVEKEHNEKKREKGGIEFSDMEQMTLSLLVKKSEGGYIATEYCKRLRAEYDEIFIDEYQDINPLQDLIFEAVSKKNNRFMVGDVKQSIYRFRNAYPDIFESYKENAADYPSSGDMNRIFLTRNFRCSKGIIDFTNAIFEKIYTKENVGSSYAKEKLIFAKGAASESADPKIELFYDEREDDDEAKNEKEASFVAEEILRLKESFVKENGEALRFSDVALLFSSAKGVSYVFENALRKRGIPVSGEKGVDLFTCPEILTAVSFLKAADNSSDDIPLASVMRSPLSSFTADELYRIRKDDKDCSLYDSVSSYAAMRKAKEKHIYRCSADIASITPRKSAEGGKLSFCRFRSIRRRKDVDPALAQKCFSFLKKLNGYRIKALSIPLHELVWSVYEDCGLARAARASDDGENAMARLTYFYDIVRDFEKGVNASLSSLNAYLDHLKSLGKTFVPTKDSDDAVRLMTVHHSKGLEFPVVFLCDANKTFNTDSVKSKVIVNRRFGVCFRLTDEDGLRIKETLIRKAAAAVEKRASQSEEARKLYVALTRPKELLYVTATLKEKRKKTFGACSSLLDMIFCGLDENEEKKYLTDIRKDETLSSENATVKKAERESFLTEETLEGLDFSYKYQSISALPEKLSVSELRTGLFEDAEYQRKLKTSDFDSVPEFISGHSAANEIGTSNHLFMQFADFDNAEKNGSKAEAVRLFNTGMISEKQLKQLSFRKLDAFFGSDLYKRIKSSPGVFREKRFSVSEPSVYFTVDGSEDERVLIQGVIDCFFENGDGTYTVADYKTDRIKEGEEQLLIDRHSAQLNYYCRAVEAMTGKKVSAAYLYSFALSKEIAVPANIPGEQRRSV